jgi:tripartite-type tricarboxylate transporter receptor subunit TctC
MSVPANTTTENLVRFPRRHLFRLAAGAAALPALARYAKAQPYPSRPVRVIVGFAAGGVTDLMARLMGQWLAERLGQSFVIENRPGAGSNIGTEAVVRAAPDGYTLLLCGTPNTINGAVFQKMSFNFVRDIAPVAGIARVPNVMEVHPSVPAQTVPEFIAYAKANPKKLSMASAGSGTTSHVAGELFKLMTGVDLVHVPYRGSGLAVTDMLGGQVQVMFDNMVSSIPHIREGKLRALGITSAKRAPGLPDIPTIAEQGLPGFEVEGWYGVLGPKNMPKPLVSRIHAELIKILHDPEMEKTIVKMGSTAIGSSPEEFRKFLIGDLDKWSKVVKASGAKAN